MYTFSKKPPKPKKMCTSGGNIIHIIYRVLALEVEAFVAVADHRHVHGTRGIWKGRKSKKEGNKINICYLFFDFLAPNRQSEKCGHCSWTRWMNEILIILSVSRMKYSSIDTL